MSDIHGYLPLWGQWDIEELIGEGTDSKVYRAVRNTPDGQERAAIKQISVAPAEDPAQSERRARSLMALADRQIALRGTPHLTEYYERQTYRRADGGYDVFVRMELLTSLRSVMGKTEFSEAMLTQLGQDACGALQALEEAGICHGALHPSNIFLSRDGTYKLGDFGQGRTRTGSGSAREYLAPEVLTGNSLPSVGSDRYALGMVLYRLGNGLRAPFLPAAPAPVSREDRLQADRRRMRGESLPAPCGVSERMAAILLRACAPAPEKRYPTTEALRHDLTLLLTPDAEPEMPTERTIRPQVQTEQPKRSKQEKKRNPAFAAGAVAAAVILLAGGITAAVLVHNQKETDNAPTVLTDAPVQTTRDTETRIATAPPGMLVPTETEPAQTEPPQTAAPETTVPSFDFELSNTYAFVDFEIPASGYILADSDSRYLTEADLAGMTKNQVRLACNEIFARKGRIFSSSVIRDYFSAMPWYQGTVDGSYFDNHMSSYLTEIEQANARLIVQYEHSRGWN